MTLRSFFRWLKGSGILNEIDLSYNEIGNAAANIVQQALLIRKEGTETDVTQSDGFTFSI